MNYAGIKVILGNTYGKLAELKNPINNCKKAIEAFHEALRIYTLRKSGVNYATVHMNLGNCYKTLSDNKYSVESCKKAINSYNMSIRIFKSNLYPSRYSSIRNNLGNVYFLIAKNSNRYLKKRGNCTRAIREYEEALKYITYENSPLDFARTNENLGDAILYRSLNAILHRSSVNSKKSLDEIENSAQKFRNALQFYKLEEFPEKYTQIQHTLKFIYDLLSPKRLSFNK